MAKDDALLGVEEDVDGSRADAAERHPLLA
jgi:hypothetical protein